MCLTARRQFYGWWSILQRMFDRRANASSMMMLAAYLAQNIQARREINLRHAMRLGDGLGDWEFCNESVPD